jgi:cell division protein FtsB
MITIDVKYTLICLVLIALFVLLIYLAVLAKNLITTVKNANKVIEDASVVSGIASDKATELDDIVGDLSRSS